LLSLERDAEIEQAEELTVYFSLVDDFLIFERNLLVKKHYKEEVFVFESYMWVELEVDWVVVLLSLCTDMMDDLYQQLVSLLVYHKNLI
jgi:hypothetical protein